jgi:predicted site-specific integrase-resolvase
MNETDNADLRGKHYIAYTRCGSKQGSTQSLRRQIRLIRQLADGLEMQCVDEVRSPGLSGYTPLLRWDLIKLLTRKFNDNDYDVLIMADPARLTRADGIERLEAIFAHCGVRIIYATTWPSEGTTVHPRMTEPQGRLRRVSSRSGSSPRKSQKARRQ